MTDRTNKIINGLREALAYARSQSTGARVTNYTLIVDGKGRVAIENQETGIARILPTEPKKPGRSR